MRVQHSDVQRLVAKAAVTVIVLISSIGCVSASSPADQDLTGSAIEVLGSWSGVEQQHFERVLRKFENRTGAAVRYTSAHRKVSDVLGRRLASGDTPDVAFLPQPGLLRQYAEAHLLVPLDAQTQALVAENYPTVWRRLSTYGGRQYGVWFKAANKSLIWYNISAFEKVGVAPPTDMTGLLQVARRLSRAHLHPFAIAGADPWTLTDWFENIFLRLEGPRQYDRLASRQIPWTDSSVVRSLQLLGKILTPAFLAGGVRGAARMTLEASIRTAFGRAPAAAMVAEGDFVAGIVAGSTASRVGVDVDVFPFPAVGASPPVVVGGGDVAVLLRPSRAGAAFLRFLAGPEAATVWAAQGGFVSPNVNVDLAAYPNGIIRSIARSLLEAGDGFRFDLSDLQPSSFGGTDGRGMLGELQRFLLTRNARTAATRLEASARTLVGGVTGVPSP